MHKDLNDTIIIGMFSNLPQMNMDVFNEVTKILCPETVAWDYNFDLNESRRLQRGSLLVFPKCKYILDDPKNVTELSFNSFYQYIMISQQFPFNRPFFLKRLENLLLLYKQLKENDEIIKAACSIKEYINYVYGAVNNPKSILRGVFGFQQIITDIGRSILSDIISYLGDSFIGCDCDSIWFIDNGSIAHDSYAFQKHNIPITFSIIKNFGCTLRKWR